MRIFDFFSGAQNQRNKDIKIQQQQMIRPPFYLNQQQLQTLQILQNKMSQQLLNPQEQQLLHQLQHQFRLMQQHQHQQRQQQVCIFLINYNIEAKWMKLKKKIVK